MKPCPNCHSRAEPKLTFPTVTSADRTCSTCGHYVTVNYGTSRCPRELTYKALREWLTPRVDAKWDAQTP